MNRQYCDRCETETTGVRSAHVMGIDDADVDGQGDVTREADLCAECYAWLLNWLKPAPADDAVDPHAEDSGPTTTRAGEPS